MSNGPLKAIDIRKEHWKSVTVSSHSAQYSTKTHQRLHGFVVYKLKSRHMIRYEASNWSITYNQHNFFWKVNINQNNDNVQTTTAALTQICICCKTRSLEASPRTNPSQHGGTAITKNAWRPHEIGQSFNSIY